MDKTSTVIVYCIYAFLFLLALTVVAQVGDWLEAHRQDREDES